MWRFWVLASSVGKGVGVRKMDLYASEFTLVAK